MQRFIRVAAPSRARERKFNNSKRGQKLQARMKTLFAIGVLLLAAAAVNCAPGPFDQFDVDKVDEQQSKLEQLIALMQGDDAEEDNAYEMDEAEIEEEQAVDPKKVPGAGSEMEEVEEEVEIESDDEDLLSSIQVAYQNRFDGGFGMQCNGRNGEGLYRVQSRFSARHRDRQFRFSCRRVAPAPITDCFWTPYLNNFDKTIGYTCPTNYIASGIISYHHNGHEDRRWRMKCCRNRGYHTEGCELTKNYINNFRSAFDFSAKSGCSAPRAYGSAFTGLYSFDDNRQHDRRWKVYQCEYKKNGK